MGVYNATTSGQSGFAVSDVRQLGKPEDYFGCLALDTLQFSIKGRWAREDGALELLRKRKESEFANEQGFGSATFIAPDGHPLKVYPHGGRPTYQVVLRDGDGLEIRALPKGTMPTFIFRFGARWCVENTTLEMGTWATELVGALGFETEKAQLSEAHIRCDVPTPFEQGDTERMRGLGTRKGSFNTHVYQGALSGINNLGGKKRIKFAIYDKRLEQQLKEAVLWPAVWKSYGITADSPIWRIEARWGREALLVCGLDYLGDLDAKAIRGLWHLFSSKYLTFVADAEMRTSRTEPLPKWKAVQKCGEVMEVAPVSANVDVTATQLIKQATGCIAKAMAVAGRGYARKEIEDVIAQAVLVPEERFNDQRPAYIGDLLQNVLEKCPDEVFAGAEIVKYEINERLGHALSKKALAEPFCDPISKDKVGERQ